MVEGAVIFPVLVLLYGAMTMAGRAHLRALSMQQEARAFIHAECVAPALFTSSGNSGQYTSWGGPSAYAGAIAPDSRATSRTTMPDNTSQFKPLNVLGTVTQDLEWEGVDVRALTRGYYTNLANDPNNLDQLFTALLGADETDRKTTNFSGAYMNFAGQAKGFSAQFCQRIPGDPRINISDASTIAVAELAREFLLPRLPPEAGASP